MRVIIACMAVAIILLTVDVIGKDDDYRYQAGESVVAKKADRLPLHKPQVRKPAQGQVIILPPLR